MKLPRVYEKAGSLYYVEDLPERAPDRLIDGRRVSGRPKQKWHRLCRADAGEAALHEALAAFHGRRDSRERGNMKTLLAEHRLAQAATLRSFAVRKEYERMYDVIGRAFAEFDAVEVEPGDVLDFLNTNFGEKRTARRAYKARLSTFFSWCVLNAGRTGVRENPCREIRLQAPAKRKGRMSGALYWAMHEALPEIGRLFLELCYATRQRPTEIRLLRDSSILAERIRFEPSKTLSSSAEYVEIARTPWINAALERLRELRDARLRERIKARKVIPLDEQRDPFLLLSEDGTPFTKSGLNTVWRRAREKAAIASASASASASVALRAAALPGAADSLPPGAAAPSSSTSPDAAAVAVVESEPLAALTGLKLAAAVAGHPLASALLRVTTRDIRAFALAQMETQGYPLKAIRESAAHTTTNQTEGYLNQHRERFSDAVLRPPVKP
jgi:hypothetical protein